LSNFSFILQEFPDLYQDAGEAESLALISPKASSILSRSALEVAIRWLYENDPDLEKPWDNTLNALIHTHTFRKLIDPNMFREIDLIRRIGNSAAHGKRIGRHESLASLKNLFRMMGFVAIHYARQVPTIPTFDESLIPDNKTVEKSKSELERLVKELDQKNLESRLEKQELEKQAEQIESLKEKLDQERKVYQERKANRKADPQAQTEIPILITEWQTRQLYIDQALKESGWDNLRDEREIEYEVTGMPKSTNPSGIGFADYVLWGDDGLPLAVIEAKKTMVDARKGQHQAELYANCLKIMHGQRPIIFYTNGFESYIWDDLFYISREVQGFYTKNELQLLINRRQNRKDIRKFNINTKIVERPYAWEAIKRVSEHFVTKNSLGELRGKARKSLLVMATGTGKTRISAAIVDMLTKCNWAKRVLFLADRNALVTQAKNAFATHLPHLSSIDLTREKEDNGTRLVFSTYPTIMNKIDGMRQNDVRFYGVGHFDLVIIDEAHRSVYQKYKAIFDYFDSLLIGLTATPKKDIDHNTYSLFEIEDDNPTAAYELDEAVHEQYLVPPKAISVPLKFQREGIKYKDLSKQEQQEYEEKFGDPTKGEAPDEIGAEALNRWLFNTDTVDKVLNHVMTAGIMVEGGDKLGKTIIFAKNHKHAVFIEKRFNKNYPEYSGKFMRVIDNYETKAQDLLETFVDHHVENDPQIAVSVDMMDTGVDAPRVVNLVFFKSVKSPSKFWQMIGRGTRLCPDLFGPGEDKSEFLIFDYCQNFEFFDENPDGFQTSTVKSLTQRTFEGKLEVAMLLRDKGYTNEVDLRLQKQYIDELHQIVAHLDQDRFVVRKELRYVTEYFNRSRWENISKGDCGEIKEHLAHLDIPDKADDELSRRFDVLMLSFQLALLRGSKSFERYVINVSNTARALMKKQNIPAVGTHIKLLTELQTDLFWQGVNIKCLDDIRCNLRDLIKFLDRDKQENVYTHFEDDIDLDQVKEPNVIGTHVQLKSYRDRVESYIRKNKNHITIQRLINNLPITQSDIVELEKILFDGDERGTKTDFISEYGNEPLGKFIRNIIGLDQKAANNAFTEFIQNGHLKADQMRFITLIIKHLTVNGTIKKTLLFEAPFTDVHDQGIMGIFDDSQVTKVIKIIDQINHNALVA
jgi:type I restriction enzyme, R subunit